MLQKGQGKYASQRNRTLRFDSSAFLFLRSFECDWEDKTLHEVGDEKKKTLNMFLVVFDVEKALDAKKKRLPKDLRFISAWRPKQKGKVSKRGNNTRSERLD